MLKDDWVMMMMAVFILEDALSVRTNLVKHLVFDLLRIFFGASSKS